MFRYDSKPFAGYLNNKSGDAVRKLQFPELQIPKNKRELQFREVAPKRREWNEVT